MVAEGSEGLPALVQSYIHPLGAQELPGALLLKLALVLDKCPSVGAILPLGLSLQMNLGVEVVQNHMGSWLL